MIDFHSHILPGIDDGSKDVDESIEMISMLKKQNVTTFCATSHFYADHHSPERFLQKREEAINRLCDRIPDERGNIRLGAEILYFPGISRMENLPDMCLEGTNLLLIEMPFSKWSSMCIKEIMDIADSGKYTVLLAHIERYFKLTESSTWDDFKQLGIYFQTNASNVIGFMSGMKAINMLKNGVIDVIASDAHNTTTRCPQLDLAMNKVSKKLGKGFVEDYIRHSNKILEDSIIK